MLLLPEGKYRFEQGYITTNEMLVVDGVVVVLNARPNRGTNNEEGAKLEMLIREDSKVEVEKNDTK